MTSVALAVDLGGTKVESALVDETGAVVEGTRARRPTGAVIAPEALRAALAEVLRDSIRDTRAAVLGIGIGSAGPVDRVAGTISPVNMPGLRGMALEQAVAEAAAEAGVRGVPTRLGHDGGCLALAESWIGATREARASLAIVVSTGIGGGFIVGGELLHGASGNAGHLGQTHQGDRVTLEEVASGPATVAWARGRGWAGATGEELGASALAGDAVAREAIERSARAVGRALADAATLVDLDAIAVGGGFSHVSDDYVELIGAALRQHAALPYAASARVVRSALGADGPLIGAAALILRTPR